jgi:hypothetical protein
MYLMENKLESMVIPNVALQSSNEEEESNTVMVNTDNGADNGANNGGNTSNGANNDADNGTGNIFSIQEEEALAGMSNDWIFAGWAVFKCFGPMVPECYQLTLLETGDLSKEQ